MIYNNEDIFLGVVCIMDNISLNYGEIIKKARKEKKLTQTVLGAKIGVGKTAVCNYEASSKLPPKNMFRKIAEALSYTPEEMVRRFMPQSPSDINDPHLSQPSFFSPVNRINSTLYSDGFNFWGNDSFTFPSDIFSSDDKYVCIKACDNSMAPDGICKNDHLFIRLTKDIDQKAIVLFKSKSSGNYFVRRYFRDGHIISMMPSVGEIKFEPIRFDDRDNDYEIIGIVEKILTNVK